MQVHPDSRKVGRYEILEIIGVGANSRVARAFDSLIARMVAIKLFPSELARGEARNRFVQEARVVGQISHPAVIALHDMGIDEPSQTPYLVMEFIQGQSLEKLHRRNQRPHHWVYRHPHQCVRHALDRATKCAARHCVFLVRQARAS